jgi:uncharacterized repeat protein (TIGR01451 family)
LATPRRRLLRIGLSLLASLSLVLSGGVSAFGATLMAVEIVSTPTFVTRGEQVSYVISVGNTGGTTVNHVTLEAVTPPGFTYMRALTSQGTCNAAPAVDAFCTLGQYAPGPPSLVVLIFDTAADAPLGITEFTVTVEAGEGGSDRPHSAHNDTFTDFDLTTVLAVNDDFSIHYIVPEGDDITTGGVFGATALSAANPQGTRAVVPATPMGLPASVSEVGGPNDNCPAAFIDDCFGQTSVVSVGNGVVLDPYLVVQVRFDDSEVPNGLNDRKLVIIHWFDPYPTAGYEEITARCSDTTPAVSELPCRLRAEEMDDGDWLVTIYMESNGFIKGRG